MQSTENYALINKRIVVKAKRIDDNESYVILNSGYSATAANFGYNSRSADNTYKYNIHSKDDYIELISDKISTSSAKLDFRAKNVKIVSIIIKDEYELVLDENKPTALLKGTKTEDVNFKYTPKTGWNTICVPFQLRSTAGTTYDHLETIFGSDYSAFNFSGYTDGTLSFTKNIISISANTPLLVYAPNGGAQAAANPDGFTLSSNVTIAYSNGESARATTVNGVTFQGTYAPIAAGAESALVGNYGITNAGQIVNAGASSSIKGYRAYLTGLGSAGARIMILDDDSDTPTDIGLFKMADPEAKDVYTLSGQRVQKARKGIYVINGKKIVIK